MKKWGLAGAAVVVLVGVALAGWWFLTPHQDRSVAMPADDAAPERVVEVYVDALDAGDCDTARALHDPASRDSSWCDDVVSLALVSLEPARIEQPEWSGQPAGVEVVSVGVDLDLERRPFGDSSLDALETWSYRLARLSADAPWRIIGQGMG